MEQQSIRYDCGPSVSLMADALVSGLLLSIITCAAVTSMSVHGDVFTNGRGTRPSQTHYGRDTALK